VIPSWALASGLFDGGGDQVALKLADSQPFSNGVISLTYQPAERAAHGLA
jgi:hypothetical protein